MDKKWYHGESTVLKLHEVFRVIGDQLTARDVQVLKLMYDGIFTPEFMAQIHDGFTFLQALEKIDRIDESNFKNLENYLRMINRHDLFQFLSLRKRKIVTVDPVTQYLEDCARSNTITPSKNYKPAADDADSSQSAGSPHCSKTTNSPGKRTKHVTPKNSRQSLNVSDNSVESSPKRKRRCQQNSPRRSERLKRRSDLANDSLPLCGRSANDSTAEETTPIKVNATETQRKKVTCDIRLRVRAEYVNHETALSGNVHSNKPERIERQFERFIQANTILKSRDLGSIICDIKFSELTYLDAFWRDYINGSLLEALKGVFITESLKQAVGHEAIKLLVNVDEDDYEAGRLVLLNSLKEAA